MHYRFNVHERWSLCLFVNCFALLRHDAGAGKAHRQWRVAECIAEPAR